MYPLHYRVRPEPHPRSELERANALSPKAASAPTWLTVAGAFPPYQASLSFLCISCMHAQFCRPHGFDSRLDKGRLLPLSVPFS